MSVGASEQLDATARRLLAGSRLARAVQNVTPLGSHGGLSGSRIWRVSTPGQDYCLKAWPKELQSRERPVLIHRLLNVQRPFPGVTGLTPRQSLPFLPRVEWLVDPTTGESRTCVSAAGRLWDLTTWMPGVADFQHNPSTPRLEAALRALAEVHVAWQPRGQRRGPCPAAHQRRDRLAAEWLSDLPRIATLAKRSPAPDVSAWACRAVEQVARWREAARSALAPFLETEVPLQYCLRDIWHDHVLFEGDCVSGIVDFGGVDEDSVSTDLARLIGSLVEDDVARRAQALAAYESLRPLTEVERRLVDVLDRTGVVVGAANWLRWLYLEGRGFEGERVVVRRLATLVCRMEKWHTNSEKLVLR
jgi:Ser/Thr protein kinase RdoA (MazF antagonist)